MTSPSRTRPGEVAVGARWPSVIDGSLVVAATVAHRNVPLSAPCAPDVKAEPVTTATSDGREIFRRSAALALLEAARRIGAPKICSAPSIRTGRVMTVADGADAAAWIAPLAQALAAIVAADEAFGVLVWPIDDAEAYFRAAGWDDAVALLEMRRDHVVEVVQLGETRALRMGTMLPRTGLLQGIAVLPHPSGVFLDFGPAIRRELEVRALPTLEVERRAPHHGGPMTSGQRAWLEPLGVTSVGHFGRALTDGQVRDLVYVSEGFHEKHVAQLADAVVARGNVRVVCFAGPSSSGKTTFIKRTKVQLEVVGLHPWELSLDDYYVDRDRTARDEHGELDFEAIEALDLDLLASHLDALLVGTEVRLPRYDFLSGKSLRERGPAIRLGRSDVLLVEGIHALNPRILAMIDPGVSFRVFVHPATSLAFDRLTVLEPSDVRLLRRLVRDRHQRGHSASETLSRWASVRRGERRHIEPYLVHADRIFDTSLVYEPGVLKVFAERYLLEVPRGHPQRPAASRLRALLEPFVPMSPDHVPPNSILREFIGGSGFSY